MTENSPAFRRSRLAATRPAVLALAGLGLVGALAGCAASTGTSAEGSSGSDSGSGTSSDSGTSSGSAHFKDGSYSADGDYQSPGGPQSITVKLTLKDDEVSEITVTPHASSGDAKNYQTQFANGISEKVVGKRIDQLTDVSRVSGSSLTSDGFQKAIAQIESTAKA